MALEGITDANFIEFVTSGSSVLIYGRDLCEDCKVFIPRVEHVASRLRPHIPKVRFGQVDVTKTGGEFRENILDIMGAHSYRLESVPTVELYSEGEKIFSYHEESEHPEHLTEAYLMEQLRIHLGVNI